MMRDRLIGLLSGYMPVQLAYVMTRLELADLLGGGPLTVGELSTATGTRPELLRRLVRGLAGIGLVGLGTGDRVSLTEMGALLGSRTPGSLRDIALHRGGASFAAWGELEHAVKTGESAFETAHGDAFFDYLRRNPDAGAAFDGAMARLSDRVVEEAVQSYDFGAASRVLDVGGGRGHFVAAVLDANPELEGAVFEVPEVSGAACAYLRAQGLGDRSLAIGGNFLERVPRGYDLHILKWILHDWDDEASRELLAASRAALPEDGRLLIVEQLLPEAVPDNGALHPAVAMDLIMLVNFADARERHLREYEQLLATAGFEVHEVVTLPSGFSILDCRVRPPDRRLYSTRV
jgi:orsellinic acid C2-O-methyltransferase